MYLRKRWDECLVELERSIDLSPNFALGHYNLSFVRSVALVRLERFEDAAGWAVRAAARPNAFPHIHAIAAYSLALAGLMDQARLHAAAARRTTPGYGISEFLLTFPFEPRGEELFRKGAKLIGME